MRLFAIGDLHMSGGDDKPMDIFGPQWDRHFFHIRENWLNLVRDEDVVLVPGDISWAMQLQDAAEDLAEIGRLPGRKILCKGNHDYWWNSISRVRSAVPPSITVLQHSAADLKNFVVCGTRGWTIPTEDNPLSPPDEKIYRRELARLDLALGAARRIAPEKPLAVMLHYPPLYQNLRHSGFTERMEQAGARLCVYGHLHGSGIAAGFSGEQNGVRYELTSCDSQDFAVRKINFL